MSEVLKPNLIGACSADLSVAAIKRPVMPVEGGSTGGNCLNDDAFEVSVPIRTMENEAGVADHEPDAAVRLRRRT